MSVASISKALFLAHATYWLCIGLSLSKCPLRSGIHCDDRDFYVGCMVLTAEGENAIYELEHRSARQVQLKSLNKEHTDILLNAEDVSWMARVIWVSQ